jgi:glucose-6-phosphate 1-epimerase
VPVLFPQFANHGPLAKHGFARNLLWQQQKAWTTTADCGAIYTLDVADHAVPAWPHAAALVLEMRLQASALHMQLQVTNTGKSAFAWTGGLHPYWWVPSVQDARIKGLHCELASGMVLGAEGFERLYPNTGAVMLETGPAGALQLQASGFADWMVWNPGQAGALLLADMPPDDWQQFVCIESVCVSQPVVLEPGENFAGTLKAQWLGL